MPFDGYTLTGFKAPTIKRLRRIDTAPALADLMAHPELWTQNTFRQTAAISAHRDTETIYVHAAPTVDGRALMDIVPTIDWLAMELPGIRHLMAQVMDGASVPLARAMIVKLLPGGTIQQHTDGGPFADATERWHVPLLTNPWAWLRAGDTTVNMRVGTLYWFDKHVPHAGANDGPTERWHLIVDTYRGCVVTTGAAS